MTTYTFTGAVAYDRLGSSWRTAAGLRSVSVTDPATGLLPTNLVQGGLAVSWLTADANSRYSFTCDVPGVVVDFGAGAEALYANEVPGLAIAAGGATNTAIDTHLGGDATGLVTTVAGKLDTATASSTYGRLTALLPSITPLLMASPPTVVVTNNTMTTGVATPKTNPGTSYTSILPDDLKAFLPLGVGASVLVRGAAGSGYLGTEGLACAWLVSSAGIPEIVRLAFTFDGTVFELMLRQFASNQYRIMVDGQYVTQYPQTLGGTSGYPGLVKVTFATRATRQIVVELNAVNDLWWGCTWQVNDSMRAIAPPKRRLVVVGDSYAGGGGTSPIGTFVSYMAHALGFRDFVNSSIGSTGWLVAGSYANIATRLATDVIAQNPTDVVIALGHNDTSQTNAAITAQVQAVLASIRAALPNLRSLVVTGPLFSSDVPGVYTAMNAAILAGCAASGATFVDTVATPIFTGTGCAGATTGVGNADLYIVADGTHPNDAGSAWLGAQLAERIRNALT